MAKYPTELDDASSLYSPADAFSTKPLDTTTTTIVLVGDSTISVSSTSGGFAATYGILSIDDELIIYTAKTGTQFTGCQRGAFGTSAAQHALGATVLANMVSGFLTAVQSAVLAIETELGTAAARNYVLAAGAVTITGLKTFQDGAEFGSGNKASTGLVRLPNTGAVKWRKADDSGDLGMGLNASDHVAMDAIIDFAAGQTFGAFSYPDATTTSKGIVQIDPVGGLAVAAGVASLAATGVVAGTYPKVTVDAKGRVTGATTLVSGDLPAHAHAESDVTGLVTDLAAKAAKAGDTFTGTLRIGGDQAYLECGPYQTVGGAFENMAKYSEDFSAATWDENGGSCSVTSNSTVGPDGNQTADTITAVSDTPIIQQQIAGLVSGGQYTFYVWGKVATGTKQVSIAIVDNAYAGYLAGTTSITLTTAWQRFKITGTLASGQTGLWIVLRQFAGNSDNWTAGAICLWGACLQQGNDPKIGYARTWASQTANVAAGIACGSVVIAAKDNAESPLRIYGPGSNLADHRLFEVTAGGELILSGGTGNGYRFAELMGATNPSGWSGVLKVKTPAGATAGYILLYSNP
jgi:hypothetical protein